MSSGTAGLTSARSVYRAIAKLPLSRLSTTQEARRLQAPLGKTRWLQTLAALLPVPVMVCAALLNGWKLLAGALRRDLTAVAFALRWSFRWPRGLRARLKP